MEESSKKEDKNAKVCMPKKKLTKSIESDLDDSDLWPDGVPSPKQYTDGWPEDKWEEEMEKHPFFMTKPPKPDEDLPPLLEGLQQLKYDENENSPEELAISYKDEGNYHFKKKKYSNSIANYTTGLKYNCSNELKSQLLNNRSAAHFYLGNYRSSWDDCKEVLKLNPNYSKAQNRIAQCLYHLEKYEECIAVCDDILNKNGDNSVIKELKKNAISKKKMKDCVLRKKSKQKKAEDERDEKTMDLIKAKGLNIKLEGNKKFKHLSDLNLPPDLSIHLDRVYYENGRLFWPVLYIFPELELTWPINEFDEYHSLSFMLLQIRDGLQEYDVKSYYQPLNVKFYYENEDLVLVEVNADDTLAATIQNPRFCIKFGVLKFFIYPKNSRVETISKIRH